MSNVTLRWNRSALGRILKSTPVVNDIRRRTGAVRSGAASDQGVGPGYNSTVDTTSYGRPVGRVWSIGRSRSMGEDRALRLVSNLDRGR